MRQLIDDTLKDLALYSLDAANLVEGTGAHESGGWVHDRQLGNGPALGYWQMEPFTFNSLVNDYLYYRAALKQRVMYAAKITKFEAEDLVTNDRLAIVMCRIKYLGVKEAMPSTLEGYAAYWKKYYNTPEGAGTEQQFIDDYHRYVLKDL